jgi:shikimate dehydrogenase
MTMRHSITGAALVAGIAGQPVSHSLSPIIHNAWMAGAGDDAAYVPFAPKDETGFDALVAAGRAGLIAGLNVTAPFKEQAFALADEASAAAKAVSSANILIFKDGRVRADSSDGMGVLYALKEQAPALDLNGASVVILGAGGAARAGAGALIEAGARIGILNRTRDRAETLASDLGPSVSVVDEAALPSADLVINALSIRPLIDLAILKPSAVVMDMTYRPVVTPFLQAARDRDLVTVDGLAMLIGQAAPFYQALFQRDPPAIDLRQLLIAHLGAAA